jgi:hypothetical protein
VNADAFWSTEELLRERSELLRVLGMRNLDEADLTLATGGRRYLLEELQELEAELDRWDHLEARDLRNTWRRAYSEAGLLLAARLNKRVRVSGLLDAYGLECTLLHGYEVYNCPLPTHESVDLTFRVFQDDNTWSCKPCGAFGGVYDLAFWMKQTPLFQRIVASHAESAGVAYDPERWQAREAGRRQDGETARDETARDETETMTTVVDDEAMMEAAMERIFGKVRDEDEDAA